MGATSTHPGSLGESRGQAHPPTLEMLQPPGTQCCTLEWWRAAAGKAENGVEEHAWRRVAGTFRTLGRHPSRRELRTVVV